MEPTMDDEEKRIELMLEQACQEVKEIARKEREGERISPELLGFLMG